ncbi:transcriptional regulator [Natroniella sp. ANB-PHB2]|uniref:transcriptional regulator n=1 Tax=Natroniella sp. ANB-PHB2 TaxID=3384444 RepID=UPI0038D3F561
MSKEQYNTLKYLMQINGLSRKDIAEIGGIKDVSTVSRKIKDGDFWLQEAKPIADHFGMSVDELFFSEPVVKLQQKAR